jgi:large subunit ribosomal protein L10
MAQPAKVKRVEELKETLNQAKSIYMTDFTGLSVEDITRLRRELRKGRVSYVVVKNTLARISAQQTGLDKIVPYLDGPTGLAIALEDPVAPGRILFDFQKDKQKLKIKAAFMEGQILDEKSALEVRLIPPRGVLMAQVVTGIAAPLSNLVGSLQALLSNLAFAINAVKEKKE